MHGEPRLRLVLGTVSGSAANCFPKQCTFFHLCSDLDMLELHLGLEQGFGSCLHGLQINTFPSMNECCIRVNYISFYKHIASLKFKSFVTILHSTLKPTTNFSDEVQCSGIC